MQKINKKIILISITLIFLLCLSSVSAEDSNKKNINNTYDDAKSIESVSDSNINIENDEVTNVLCSTTSSKNNDLTIKSKNNIKNSKKISLPDLNDEYTDYIHHIDSNNLSSYLNNGILKDEFKDSILIFNGEFVDKGIITVRSPNIQIIGNNTLFKNTVFCLESPNILISDFNFVLDDEFSSNDYAGILVLNNNNTIYNCTIIYTVPNNRGGFCVYCEGSENSKINGFNLINNTFNFIVDTLNVDDCYDYCVFMEYTDNAIIYGNTINAQLPLCTVDWSQDIYMGVRMDKAGAFIADTCENLTLINNDIKTKVTSRVDEFPTLDTVIIYACNNSVIENNIIYSEDLNEDAEGTANYLYGLDLYLSDNVTIINNEININTNGGCESNGAAYPIQVTGRAIDVKIAYNTITSVNKGPNIGIYSNNFFGKTKLEIISNFIEVTGLASKDNWALVSGIEVQDTDDLIWNNTIIVHNIGDYDDNNNIYGISYSQNTIDNHIYNIQYNTITTDGIYSISLQGNDSLVVNSIIANNILNSLKNDNEDGNSAVRVDRDLNNSVYNNTKGESRNSLKYDDLPDWLKNHKTPIVSQPRIIVPKHANENSGGSGVIDDEGNGNMPLDKPGNNTSLNNDESGNNTRSQDVSSNENQKTTTENNQNTENQKTTTENNQNTENQKTTTENNQSMSKTERKLGPKHASRHVKKISLNFVGDSKSSQSNSPSNSGSSAANSKAYEVKEKAKKIINSDNPFPAIVISALILLLIFLGYKYNNKKEEE